MERKVLVALALATLFGASLNAAVAQTKAPSDHWHAAVAPAPGDMVDRVIEIRAGTQYVNVTGGETILFKVGSKSFVRKFYTMLDHGNFDLSEIAPSDLDVRGVRVFCDPDLYERSA